MKGLESIPSLNDLKQAYDVMLSAPPTLDQLALYTQWVRFDARLAEILVDYFCNHWACLNPMYFQKALEPFPWKNSVGVLLEFVSRSQPNSKFFISWKNLMVAESLPAHFEQYFIGDRKIAGNIMINDASYSLNEYLKWGYLGREILFNKPLLKNFSTHSYNALTREKIAEKLIKESPRLYTNEFLSALGNCISRRQAERDLKSFPFLKACGNTKSRYFRKK